MNAADRFNEAYARLTSARLSIRSLSIPKELKGYMANQLSAMESEIDKYFPEQPITEEIKE